MYWKVIITNLQSISLNFKVTFRSKLNFIPLIIILKSREFDTSTDHNTSITLPNINKELKMHNIFNGGKIKPIEILSTSRNIAFSIFPFLQNRRQYILSNFNWTI